MGPQKGGNEMRSLPGCKAGRCGSGISMKPLIRSVVLLQAWLWAQAQGVALPAAAAKEPTTASAVPITRLAFGSCNRQKEEQTVWKHIEAFDPDAWLWMGDAVYVEKYSDGGVEKMKEAFEKQLSNADYQRFLSKVPRVEGVWDDHDYGVNDAGKELGDKARRVDAFLDFLGVSQDDPRRGRSTLYSSHTFGTTPNQVKVIFLDVRTQRDPYHIFNISSSKVPYAAMAGAFLRLMLSHFCIGSEYAGQVMGEDQWDWLAAQLRGSEASVHIIVSSLQVLTSNPLPESWGQFPHSRHRLLELLAETDPAGLVILSGDVHHAELISGVPEEGCQILPEGGCQVPEVFTDNGLGQGEGRVRAGAGAGAGVGGPGSLDSNRGPPTCGDCDEGKEGSATSTVATATATAALGGEEGRGRGVVEVTTSGMTHSCNSTYGPWACSTHLGTFPRHRWSPDSYYIGSNFGTIEIEWGEDEGSRKKTSTGILLPARLNLTVRGTDGEIVLPEVVLDGRQQTPVAIATTGDNPSSPPPSLAPLPPPPPTGRVFFASHPPPSSCAVDVIPAGCTVAKLWSLAGTVGKLVCAWFGLSVLLKRLKTGKAKD